MLFAERIGVLALCEIKLILRDRRKWVILLCLALLGGSIFGFAGREFGERAGLYGLAFLLTTSVLFLAVFTNVHAIAESIPPGFLGRPFARAAISSISWMISTLLVLIMQSTLYVLQTSLMDVRYESGFVLPVLILVACLLLGVLAFNLARNRSSAA
jgi:hypothetical protein